MEIVRDILITIISSGGVFALLGYLFKKKFESKLNIWEQKYLHKHNNLYIEKLQVIKELYKRMVIAEAEIAFLLQPLKLNPNRTEEEIAKDVVEKGNSFYNYFDENEIILDEDIYKIINLFRDKFNECWICYQKKKLFESSIQSEEWKNAENKCIQVYEDNIVSEMPKIKEDLKIIFKKLYEAP